MPLDYPQWVELAEFGPDEEGHSYTLVRVFQDDLGLYNLDGLVDGNKILSGLLRKSWTVNMSFPRIFAILKLSHQWGSESVVGAFCVMSEPDKHQVSQVVKNTLKAIEYPLTDGIILWAVTELFGFDLDTSVSWLARLQMKIPSIVRDGALDRFRAEPAVQYLDRLAGQRSSLQSWDDAELDRADSQISKAHHEVLKLATLLVPEFEVDDAVLIEANLGQLEGYRTISRDFYVVRGLETITAALVLPSPASMLSNSWSLESYEIGHLGNAPDLASALEASHIVLEESKWEPLYAKRLERVVNPQILLDIDIEPYLLLDALTPYMWPQDDFIEMLKGEGKL